jgi:hypothetical protein
MMWTFLLRWFDQELNLNMDLKESFAASRPEHPKQKVRTLSRQNVDRESAPRNNVARFDIEQFTSVV